MTRDKIVALCAASIVIAILWVALEPVGNGVTSAPAASGKSALPAQPQSRGTIKVDRVWQEYDYGEALVSYTNDSNSTFATNVTVRCDALGANRAKVGTQTSSFFAFEHGPVRPGFTGTVQVHVKLNGAEFKEMNCWIESAN